MTEQHLTQEPAQTGPSDQASEQASHRTPWHAVADWLRFHERRTVFGLPGDDLGLLEALEDADTRLVLCRDQRNAVFMTTGYALASGGFGVCVVGKGPALTNTLTGLLEARTGGVPLVLIAGGTGADRRGSGAFQELDQLALVQPLVSWAHRVDDPARLPAALDKAAALAAAGVPGPVYLEIPDHLLEQAVPHDRPWAAVPVRLPSAAPADDAGYAVLAAARRPVLLVGGGMRGRNEDRVLERLAERTGAAVFATASGRGAFDEHHPAFAGLAGLYTPQTARELWQSADAVVALGSRLEETATYPLGFAPAGVPVVQVNTDPAGLSHEFAGPRLVGDAPSTAAGWLARLEQAGAAPDEERQAAIAAVRERVREAAGARLAAAAAAGRLTVAQVLAELDEAVGPDRILVQENGLSDMWSYFHPYWVCGPTAGSIVPSEQTSLGFGASAAGGAALAAPGRTVVALVGDGAFAMVANDLRTLAREGAPVLYVVLRNGGYGWLQRQLDERGTPSRFRFTHDAERLHVPDLDGVHHLPVEPGAPVAELREALRQAVAVHGKGGIAVLEVAVELGDVSDEIVELSHESAPAISY